MLGEKEVSHTCTVLDFFHRPAGCFLAMRLSTNMTELIACRAPSWSTFYLNERQTKLQYHNEPSSNPLPLPSLHIYASKVTASFKRRRGRIRAPSRRCARILTMLLEKLIGKASWGELQVPLPLSTGAGCYRPQTRSADRTIPWRMLGG